MEKSGKLVCCHSHCGKAECVLGKNVWKLIVFCIGYSLCHLMIKDKIKNIFKRDNKPLKSMG